MIACTSTNSSVSPNVVGFLSDDDDDDLFSPELKSVLFEDFLPVLLSQRAPLNLV
jgi:hypothetical protein